jgi:hypothetical protein
MQTCLLAEQPWKFFCIAFNAQEILLTSLKQYHLTRKQFSSLLRAMQTCLVRLNNLGISFQSRFEHTGDLTDISEAISFQQKAVQLTPEGHADMPAHLNNLGISFQIALNTQEISLTSLKQYHSQQKAVQLTPEGHADMPGGTEQPWKFTFHRFEHTGDLTDISEAISSSRKQFSSLLRAMQTCLLS